MNGLPLISLLSIYTCFIRYVIVFDLLSQTILSACPGTDICFAVSSHAAIIIVWWVRVMVSVGVRIRVKVRKLLASNNNSNTNQPQPNLTLNVTKTVNLS